jgi:hypothetical protein
MDRIPILKLRGDAEIRSLHYDPSKGVVLVGTSDGRIIAIDSFASTGFLTGARSVSGQFMDGFGNVSDAAWSNITYCLHNKILEVASDRSILDWKSVSKPFSAESAERISGIFTSPVLWGGDDFVRWDNLVWSQALPAGSSVRVGVRVGETPESVLGKGWSYFSGDGAGVTRSLDGFNLVGSYMQIQVTMDTEAENVTPMVSSLSVTYETKFAVYFFTVKMVMEKGTNINSGLITGHMTIPQNTEVKFGIAKSNTADWHDYVNVDLDKVFEVPPDFKDRMKVGIKFVSYSPSAYPVVDEFAIAVGGDKYNRLN